MTKKQQEKTPKKSIPNEVGSIRQFEGIDYELKSTGIITEFGETYREGWYMSVKDYDNGNGEKRPKTLLIRCRITNQPDVDMLTVNEDCLLDKNNEKLNLKGKEV